MTVVNATGGASYRKVFLAIGYPIEKNECGLGQKAVQLHQSTDSTRLLKALNHANKFAAAA